MKKLSIAICNTGNNKLAQFALNYSLKDFPVNEVLVFSDTQEDWHCDKFVKIDPIKNINQYEDIVLDSLVEYVTNDHCLVIQYDGFILNPSVFSDIFTSYDYIGAPWEHFKNYRVGNGGFSLRSKRLLNSAKEIKHKQPNDMPEDVFISRHMRTHLEDDFNIKFPHPSIASHFSFEPISPSYPTFGFHGLSNLLFLFRNEIAFVIENLDNRCFNPDNYFYANIFLKQNKNCQELYLKKRLELYGR